MATTEVPLTLDELFAAIPPNDPRQNILRDPRFTEAMRTASLMPDFGGSSVLTQNLNALFPGLVPKGYRIVPKTGEVKKNLTTAQKALLAVAVLAAPVAGFAASGGFSAAAKRAAPTPTVPPAPTAPGGTPPSLPVTPYGGGSSGTPDWLNQLLRGGAGLAVSKIGQSAFGPDTGKLDASANSLQALVDALAPHLGTMASQGAHRAEASQPLYDQVLKMAQMRLPAWSK